MRKNLTNKEKNVLRLAFLTDKEISLRLKIAVSTVKTYFHNINNILTAFNRTEAVLKALKYGEITIEEIEV